MDVVQGLDNLEKNQWKNELNVKQIARLENKFRDFITKFSYD